MENKLVVVSKQIILEFLRTNRIGKYNLLVDLNVVFLIIILLDFAREVLTLDFDWWRKSIFVWEYCLGQSGAPLVGEHD